MILLRAILPLLGIFVAIFPISAQHKLPVASEDITFELNFNGENSNMNADLAAGNPKLITHFGKLKFEKGLTGNALYCGKGGAKLRYHLKGNLDFSNPGSITMWIYPIDWEKAIGQPRVLFFGTESRKGFLGIQTANSPKTISPLERKLLCMLIYFKAIHNTSLLIPGFGTNADNHWQMITFSWEKNRIFMSANGNHYSVKNLQGNLANELFPDNNFSVGSDAQANYLLDNFRIYRRKLTEEEINKIWKNESPVNIRSD